MPLKSYISLLVLVAVLLSCNGSHKISGNKNNASPATSSVSDKSDSALKAGKPASYTALIPSTSITTRGLFTIHKVSERYYLEIPDSLMGRYFLVVNRISKSSMGGRIVIGSSFGYAGDQINESLIRFEAGPAHKLFLKQSYYTRYTEVAKDSTENGLYRSVLNSSLEPIAAAFNIKAYSPDSSAVVVDVTDYLNGDNDIFSFGLFAKNDLHLGGYQPDKSYIEKLYSFPSNIEIRTIKTYSLSTEFRTFELNSSIVLLPKAPMRSRAYDQRIGYFSTDYVDFDANPQGVEEAQLVTRWRLEPKKQDVEKYMKGELVEPQKPIVFYIDPSTPKKWVPYLIQGVNAWQQAFEKAGFKNAIYAREAPTPKEDPTWSLEDSRYSALVYKPANIMNASGPHVHDPRSGEIIESHINWYHNVMQLLHDWYFVQTAAIDARARKMEFPDELMGKLIRFVCTHEIGHTLGLTHNFGASSSYPVDSLRNKQWVEEHGICPSIMDYARFNYVAQPEDNIGEKGIMPRIGPYDMWAIEWGYRWFPENLPPKEEKLHLNNEVVQRLQDKSLRFGSENLLTDPRNQSEDLGDDAIKASYYGILNLKRIVPNLKEWTSIPGDNYTDLKRMYDAVFNQFKTYLLHVADNIGGCMYTYKTVEQHGPIREYTSKEKQKASIAFLKEQLFNTPEWILNKEIFALTDAGGIYRLQSLQRSILEKILSQANLGNLLWFETNDPQHAYSIQSLLTDMEDAIWNELKQHKPISLYRRNLQKMYATQLINLYNPYLLANSKTVIEDFYKFNLQTDAPSITKGQINILILKIQTALPYYKDYASKMHLEDVLDRLKKALNPTEK